MENSPRHGSNGFEPQLKPWAAQSHSQGAFPADSQRQVRAFNSREDLESCSAALPLAIAATMVEDCNKRAKPTPEVSSPVQTSCRALVCATTDLALATQPAYLLMLPEDVFFQVLSCLDAKSIVRLQTVCRAFEGISRPCGTQLSLLEKAARESLLRKYSERPEEAERWRHYSWFNRMRIEETESAFDSERCARSGFQFVHGANNRIEKLKLEGIGPRMLVSEESTKTADFLHWRLEVRGNNAVELGVVPEALQDSPKALHKCQVGPNNERPTGLFSSITVGSLLPVRVPLMKGSDIEVLAWPTKLEFLITQPMAGYEMTWINSTTVPRPYTGPRHIKLEIDLDIKGPAKLALTCWAHAEFALPSSGTPRVSTTLPGVDPTGALPAAMPGGMLLPVLPMPGDLQQGLPLHPGMQVPAGGQLLALPMVPGGQPQPQHQLGQEQQAQEDAPGGNMIGS